MYRIRFHGRGGQGMKTASRILGNALFLAGFEVQDAPRYGAERRGAPIFAYVRAAQQAIHERGIIHNPDLVIVADDSLVAVPAAGVLQGLDSHSVLLINSIDTLLSWKQRLNTPAKLIVIPLTEETEDRTALSRLGTHCAAAAAQLLGVVSVHQLQESIQSELSTLGSEIVTRNQQLAATSYNQLKPYQGSVREGTQADAHNYIKPQWIELPLEIASVATPSIHAKLTSHMAKTGVWRSLRPVIDYSLCKRCWWVCSEFCPDGAIQVDSQAYPHIDLDHCKGCMICMAQCPPHAIRAISEAHIKEETGIGNNPTLNKKHGERDHK